MPGFRLRGVEVEDLIHKWVRLWDAKVSGMNECPRSASHDAPWSSGYVPNRDRYGGYLGWHGLMLAAGEMLATRVVTGQDWGGDAWDAFSRNIKIPGLTVFGLPTPPICFRSICRAN